MITKTGINLKNVEIGDIHYEYDYGMCIKSEVITKPVRDEEGAWTWKSKEISTGEEIEYLTREGYAHYGSNLYDYEAYIKVKNI